MVLVSIKGGIEVVLFKKILLRYDPVFATGNLICMKRLEGLLRTNDWHCYIDVKGYPVYVMKCPKSVSASVKQWISDEEFSCDTPKTDQ